MDQSDKDLAKKIKKAQYVKTQRGSKKTDFGYGH
jgi:hypothetical protein